MSFKPEVRVITQESNNDYWNRQGKSQYLFIAYPTYKELKKRIKQHLFENLEPTVTVSRSRKGEWGEWFEHWQLVNGKPQIIKQGWM